LFENRFVSKFTAKISYLEKPGIWHAGWAAGRQSDQPTNQQKAPPGSRQGKELDGRTWTRATGPIRHHTREK